LQPITEQGLEELRECVNNCNESAKSADEALLRWSDESEWISKTFVSRIVTLCSSSETLEENLLRARREAIEKDASERANAMNTLRHHREQRTLKMIELANAIVAECQSYHDESEDTLTMMKSHDVAMFENSLAHLQKLQTVIQQHEDVETDTFADDVMNKNRYFTDCIRNSLSRVEFSGEQIVNISGSNEEKRVGSQNEQLKRERAIVQHVRDSLGEVNKELSALVEKNWLSRENTGKTPKKSHYPVANDSEIPHVPKKEKMLLSKSSSISSEVGSA
uniref:Uncharacterized protein n=1 Tax=Angiostrongylus costaricensis TaxID=334426 RepID=A0A0R3Q2L1_ANGCS